MNENMINDTEIKNDVELSAGEMLRNARTTGRRKREIQTVAKQLCIREEFLQALEDGDYAAIPETVYILGFARNYAMELGLDPDVVIVKIKCEMGLASDVSADSENGDKGKAARAMAVAAIRNGFVGRAARFVRRKWIWFAGGAAALVVVILLGVLLLGGGRNDAEIDDASVVATTAPAQMITEPVYNKNVRERFGTENRNNADVILQAQQESWVKVEDARGNTVFSRVLVPGDVYYVPGGAVYKATFGNAGGVDIWVNGSLAAKAGPAHTRKSGISLNPETLAATVKKPADAE